MTSPLITVADIQNIDGELVVDSRLIAQSLDIDHGSWMTNIVLKYRGEVESDFGKLNTTSESIKNARGATNDVNFAFLNEGQALTYATYSKNTEKARAVKRSIVKSFLLAKTVLNSKTDPITALHAQIALEYEKTNYRPWRKDNPEADVKFRELVALPALAQSEPQQIAPEPVQPVQPAPVLNDRDERWMEILDGLTLMLNRVGLTGNKATKEAEFLSNHLDKVRAMVDEQMEESGRLRGQLAAKDAELADLRKIVEMGRHNSNASEVKAGAFEFAYKAEKTKNRALEFQLKMCEDRCGQSTSIALNSSPDESSDTAFPGLPPAK